MPSFVALAKKYTDRRASDICMFWSMLVIPGLRNQTGLETDVEANLDHIRGLH